MMGPSDGGESRWLEMETRAKLLARELNRLRTQNPVDLQSYRAARQDLASCLAAMGAAPLEAPQEKLGILGPQGTREPQGPLGTRATMGPQGPLGQRAPIGPRAPLGPEGPGARRPAPRTRNTPSAG